MAFSPKYLPLSFLIGFVDGSQHKSLRLGLARMFAEMRRFDAPASTTI
jgi:hypothetical protein